MASNATAPSPEFLAETNDPYLDQRVSIAFIVIDTFFLGLLYVSRYYNPKAAGTPMLVCNTLCYILCLGSATTGILMTQIGGVGHHVAAVPVTTFQTWLQLSKVLEFTYTPAVMFAKLAALFLYYQVFEVPLYRRLILVIGTVLVLQGVIAFVLAFSICRPFRYFWTQAVDLDDGHCGNVMLFYKLYSVPSLVTDVAMLVLPWPLLARLNIIWAEKIGLILTFLAASLGIITCTLRFVTFFTVPLFSDPTWHASGGPMIYALVEPSIYMIAGILPATRHLYRRLDRKARLTAQLWSAKGSSAADTRSGDYARSECSEAPIGLEAHEMHVSREDRRSSEVGSTFEDYGGEVGLAFEDYGGGMGPKAAAMGEAKKEPRELVRKKVEVRERG